MKTPEELADAYCRTINPIELMRYLPIEPCHEAFLAGYKAAQEHAHAALEEAEARIQELQDQLADADKVMPDTCEHILDMSKMLDVNVWISVKARLPEHKEIEVLVLISGDGWHDYDVAYHALGKWYDKYDDIVEGVTYWQPLPERPKEEE